MKKIRADMILILALIVTGGIIAAVLLFGNKSGGTVVVKVDGQVVKEMPLDSDDEYLIESDGQNLLVIKDGAAYMKDADCPDKLCVNMGKISRAGQSIVCLPNKVVVEIVSRDENNIDVYAE